MVATRARRLGVVTGALALGAVLAGCGNAPPPTPALGQAPATAFTGGSAELEVCDELKFTADLEFSIIFLAQDERPSRENTAQLRADLADYAEDLRAVADLTTDPALRPVLDNALAAAEDAAGVSTLDELRRTPFKTAGTELRQMCRDLRARSRAAEPDPAPPESAALGAACDLPVTFEVTDGWEPSATSADGGFDDGEVGPFTKVCDVVVTGPVGLPGSVSVATAPASAGDARTALLAYLTDAQESGTFDEVRKPTFTTRRAANGLAAAEAAYGMTRGDDLIQARVAVVEVPGGLVALRLNVLLAEDGSSRVQDGYQLALQTVRLL